MKILLIREDYQRFHFTVVSPITTKGHFLLSLSSWSALSHFVQRINLEFVKFYLNSCVSYIHFHRPISEQSKPQRLEISSRLYLKHSISMAKFGGRTTLFCISVRTLKFFLCPVRKHQMNI